MSYGLDATLVLQRALKYVVLGLAVAVSAFYIPKGGKMKLEEIALIAVSTAAVYAVLDFIAPSLGSSARAGAGFGIGTGLVGFPK